MAKCSHDSRLPSILRGIPHNRHPILPGRTFKNLSANPCIFCSNFFACFEICFAYLAIVMNRIVSSSPWLLALLPLSKPATALAEPPGSFHLFNPVPKDSLRELSTDRPDKTESPF